MYMRLSIGLREDMPYILCVCIILSKHTHTHSLSINVEYIQIFLSEWLLLLTIYCV